MCYRSCHERTCHRRKVFLWHVSWDGCSNPASSSLCSHIRHMRGVGFSCASWCAFSDRVLSGFDICTCCTWTASVLNVSPFCGASAFWPNEPCNRIRHICIQSSSVCAAVGCVKLNFSFDRTCKIIVKKSDRYSLISLRFYLNVSENRALREKWGLRVSLNCYNSYSCTSDASSVQNLLIAADATQKCPRMTR